MLDNARVVLKQQRILGNLQQKMIRIQKSCFKGEKNARNAKSNQKVNEDLWTTIFMANFPIKYKKLDIFLSLATLRNKTSVPF